VTGGLSHWEGLTPHCLRTCTCLIDTCRDSACLCTYLPLYLSPLPPSLAYYPPGTLCDHLERMTTNCSLTGTCTSPASFHMGLPTCYRSCSAYHYLCLPPTLEADSLGLRCWEHSCTTRHSYTKRHCRPRGGGGGGGMPLPPPPLATITLRRRLTAGFLVHRLGLRLPPACLGPPACLLRLFGYTGYGTRLTI